MPRTKLGQSSKSSDNESEADSSYQEKEAEANATNAVDEGNRQAKEDADKKRQQEIQDKIDRVNRIFNPAQASGVLNDKEEYQQPDKTSDSRKPDVNTNVSVSNDRVSYDKNHNLINDTRTDCVQTYDKETGAVRTSVKTQRNRSWLSRWQNDGVFDHPTG